MNGEKIPLDDGGEVRAIVPRWYGMYSFKWLWPRELVDSRQGNDYLSRMNDRSDSASSDAAGARRAARHLDQPDRYAWVRRELELELPGPGQWWLLVNAQSKDGPWQPEMHIPSHVDLYEQNGWQRISVVVG